MIFLIFASIWLISGFIAAGFVNGYFLSIKLSKFSLWIHVIGGPLTLFAALTFDNRILFTRGWRKWW